MARSRLRTSADVAEAIHKAGGLYRIGLKVDHADSQNLGHLRKICGAKRDIGAITHLPYLHKFPASGRKFYRETLSSLSQKCKTFGLDVTSPFLKSRTTLKGVALSLVSPTQMKLCSELSTAFKDVRLLQFTRRLLDSTLSAPYGIWYRSSRGSKFYYPSKRYLAHQKCSSSFASQSIPIMGSSSSLLDDSIGISRSPHGFISHSSSVLKSR